MKNELLKLIKILTATNRLDHITIKRRGELAEGIRRDAMAVPDHVEKDAGTAHEMTKTLKGGLEERVARIIFLTFMPSHMVHEDWDSGSMLGRNNAFRHKIEMVAKLVVTEINR